MPGRAALFPKTIGIDPFPSPLHAGVTLQSIKTFARIRQASVLAQLDELLAAAK